MNQGMCQRKERDGIAGFKSSFLGCLTDAGPHVHGGHESIETQTAIFTGDVGALASITDVWSLLTLINI